MKIYRSGISAALIAMALAACSITQYRDSATPIADYGNATRQNAAVMIVDPQPASAANTQLDFDGRAAGLAIERYREGKVIPPVQLKTSEVLSSSGSSGGQ